MTHLVLPSNSSMRYFPHNTMAQYRVKLPIALKLHAPHEVALTELIFPSLYANTNHITMMYVLHKRKNTNTSPWVKVEEQPAEHLATVTEVKSTKVTANNFYSMVKDRQDLQVCVMPTGRFMTPDALIGAFNKNAINCFLKYHANRDRFVLTWETSEYESITMTPALARMLGFGDGLEFISIDTCGEARFEPDVSGGHHTLMVYSTMVEDQIVGDMFAPLLRIVVPMLVNNATMRSEKYIKPYYIPVKTGSLDVIEITIRSIDGSLFPFLTGSGAVIAKLHIRPQRPL
jgi:hypothetical protein